MPEFDCGAADCVLFMRATDEAEIVQIVQRHARGHHEREVDEELVRNRRES
jgi:predicted small metal-binding protein